MDVSFVKFCKVLKEEREKGLLEIAENRRHHVRIRECDNSEGGGDENEKRAEIPKKDPLEEIKQPCSF